MSNRKQGLHSAWWDLNSQLCGEWLSSHNAMPNLYPLGLSSTVFSFTYISYLSASPFGAVSLQKLSHLSLSLSQSRNQSQSESPFSPCPLSLMEQRRPYLKQSRIFPTTWPRIPWKETPPTRTMTPHHRHPLLPRAAQGQNPIPGHQSPGRGHPGNAVGVLEIEGGAPRDLLGDEGKYVPFKRKIMQWIIYLLLVIFKCAKIH